MSAKFTKIMHNTVYASNMERSDSPSVGDDLRDLHAGPLGPRRSAAPGSPGGRRRPDPRPTLDRAGRPQIPNDACRTPADLRILGFGGGAPRQRRVQAPPNPR
ncbi:hypothetical protein GCM10009602_20190 [Nocardiopsis tropica]